MKIIHMIDSEGMYGAEYFLYNLLPSLQVLGIDVIFACLSPIDSNGAVLGRKLEKKGIKVFYINERKKISYRGILEILRIIKINRADILHVHGYKATILGGLVSKIVDIPIFSTYHAEAGKYPALSTYVRIETLFLKKAVRIIAVSKVIKKDLVARGIKSEIISVLFNGINDIANEQKKCTSSYDSKFIHLLCVGRLIPIKKYDLVIKAVSVLHKEFPNLCLSIVGEGPEESTLKSMVNDHGISARVNFPGYVMDTERLYRGADIFVLASETEGSPITLLEAMSYALPIIATEVGAIPEMVQHGKDAILISPKHLSHLIESVRYLITHPERRLELGMEARNSFEKRFNIKSVASKYKQVYEEYKNG